MDLSSVNVACCFHAHLDCSAVEPDYDFEAILADSAASSVRTEFVRRMLELERESPNDAAVRDALYDGLYALDGRKLEMRDVD